MFEPIALEDMEESEEEEDNDESEDDIEEEEEEEERPRGATITTAYLVLATVSDLAPVP
jgi:hypothetical protein